MRIAGMIVGAVVAGTVIAMAALPQRMGREAAFVALSGRAGVDGTAALPDGLHVALCGSGSPLPDPTRAGPCSVVIAGRHIFVVDAGEGGGRNMSLMRIPNGRLEAVFLTHLHSDHIDGLPAMTLLRWTSGPAHTPLPVFGPAGTAKVVDGFNRAYAIDQGFRIAHHGPGVAPPAGKGAQPSEFTLPPPRDWTAVPVFTQDGVSVSAFRVDHGPVEPAVGYRFSYKGRSIVFSGDTSATPSIARNAKGADLLIHEGLQPRLTAVMTQVMEARNQPSVAKITRDILTYHAAPEDVAREAQAAGVRNLVFSHNIPQLPSRLLYPAYLGDARKVFGGTITVGEDGMVFSLPAGRTDMAFSRWAVD